MVQLDSTYMTGFNEKDYWDSGNPAHPQICLCDIQINILHAHIRKMYRSTAIQNITGLDSAPLQYLQDFEIWVTLTLTFKITQTFKVTQGENVVVQLGSAYRTSD